MSKGNGVQERGASGTWKPEEAELGSLGEQLGKEYPGLLARDSPRSPSNGPKMHRAPGGNPAGGDFLKAPLDTGAMPWNTSGGEAAMFFIVTPTP